MLIDNNIRKEQMGNSWADKINEFNTRRKKIENGGGKERVAKQHSLGKLTARERINLLFDKGTFVEINSMILSRAMDFGMDKKKKYGDGVITGYGMVNGRMVVASSQDFTINGGSLGEAQAMKICCAMDKAYDMKVPYVSINDSGGARIEEGIDGLAGYGDIFFRNTRASGVIPQISVILGPCAGGACYSPAITDFIFLTEKNSQMYITGPNVVKSVTGEVISSSELGGSGVHRAESGVAHFVCADEYTCMESVRELLTYLPQNSEEKPPYVKGKEVDECDKITRIVPDNSKKGYDVHDVIYSFVDKRSFFEVQKDFAPNIVVGLSRIKGNTVGIVANQSSNMAGSLEINASDKAARFVRFCDCFNIPLLTLVDVPAFMPGSKQEHNGIIRHGAKILYAYAEATVPKVTLIMRKAYGGAYIAMDSKGLGADIVYAWPIAEIAVMGATGAVSIIGKKDIEESDNPSAKQEEMIQTYNEKFMTPYIAAEHGYVDEVILPEDTKTKIVDALEVLATKSVSLPRKKHGNIPL